MSLYFLENVKLCLFGTFHFFFFKCLQKQLVKLNKKILGYTCFRAIKQQLAG